MESSILISIKKLLGIEFEYDAFDTDIIIHINTVFSILHQLGVGPETGFTIVDTATQWEEYGVEDPVLLNMVKSYMGLKVRQLFDPPTGAAAEASTRLIGELEWRINVAAEPKCQVDGGEASGP